MTDGALLALAADAGLAVRWTDNDGVERDVGADVLAAALSALGFAARGDADIRESHARAIEESRAAPCIAIADAGRKSLIRNVEPREGFARIEFEQGGALDFPIETAEGGVRIPALDRIGYHRLFVDDREITLVVAPPSARTLADAGAGRRMYGLSAQIYGLRAKDEDDGFGHFGAVADLAESAARHGADALALSPAHALFGADDNHYTPYSPSSRLFLNTLYADPALVFGDERIRELRQRLQAGQGEGAAWKAGRRSTRRHDESLIDWPSSAGMRKAHLAGLFNFFWTTDVPQSSMLAADFARYRAEGGEALQSHATFEALHREMFVGDFTKWNWRDWPAALRDARSPAVADFARRNERDVAFHVFLQWLADRSMARAQGRAKHAGMRIGLVSDLAVGMNSGGSQTWGRPEDFLLGLSIGAPPDMLAPLGQNWGLTTFSPRALRAAAYAPFIATLRAALRNAGGVRIDHILGLVRLWVVPEGAKSSEGVYLSYPLDDLLALVRLESVRHAAIVIGEDLGTVPHGLRETLARSGVAGMRVMQFERDAHRFHPPSGYPATSVAMTSTHDTATVAGWWRGADIVARDAAGQTPPGRSRQSIEEERAHERAMAWDAFVAAGVAAGEKPAPERPQAAVDAAIGFVAQTPAHLVVLPVEDALGRIEQPNLPGTTTEHPNWRRHYAVAAGQMLEQPEVSGRLAALAARRD